MIAEVNSLDLVMDPALHVSAEAICSAKVVHLVDVMQSPGYLSGEPTFLTMVKDLRVRSMLSVPLCDARGALGAINVHRNEVRPFLADEIALMQSFAAQAVIAIENVRQFRELHARLEREAATRNILRVISESPSAHVAADAFALNDADAVSIDHRQPPDTLRGRVHPPRAPVEPPRGSLPGQRNHMHAQDCRARRRRRVPAGASAGRDAEPRCRLRRRL